MGWWSRLFGGGEEKATPQVAQAIRPAAAQGPSSTAARRPSPAPTAVAADPRAWLAPASWEAAAQVYLSYATAATSLPTTISSSDPRRLRDAQIALWRKHFGNLEVDPLASPGNAVAAAVHRNLFKQNGSADLAHPAAGELLSCYRDVVITGVLVGHCAARPPAPAYSIHQHTGTIHGLMTSDGAHLAHIAHLTGRISSGDSMQWIGFRSDLAHILGALRGVRLPSSAEEQLASTLYMRLLISGYLGYRLACNR